MISPLKAARQKRERTLHEVAAAVGTDTGNLSRIERGLQVPNKELTDALVRYYGGEVTEIQIMWPEKFVAGDAAETVPSAA
jgi:transcriptional regulator with XRE-family HTH domain